MPLIDPGFEFEGEQIVRIRAGDFKIRDAIAEARRVLTEIDALLVAAGRRRFRDEGDSDAIRADLDQADRLREALEGPLRDLRYLTQVESGTPPKHRID